MTWSTRWRRFLVVVLAVVATAPVAACATGQPIRAGTDDLTFRLVWAGPADLDLFVWDPAGIEVSYQNSTSASGGRLDVDCNATPETMCAQPVENISWPRGTAPLGAYHYDVRLTNQHGATLPVAFTVFTLHGRRIVKTEEGSIAAVFLFPEQTTWGRHGAVWKR